MTPVVVAYLEKFTLSHDLLYSPGMCPHPFAAHEEGSRQAMFTKEVQDSHITACSVGVELAHVERQRYGLYSFRELYPAYHSLIIAQGLELMER